MPGIEKAKHQLEQQKIELEEEITELQTQRLKIDDETKKIHEKHLPIFESIADCKKEIEYFKSEIDEDGSYAKRLESLRQEVAALEAQNRASRPKKDELVRARIEQDRLIEKIKQVSATVNFCESKIRKISDLETQISKIQDSIAKIDVELTKLNKLKNNLESDKLKLRENLELDCEDSDLHEKESKAIENNLRLEMKIGEKMEILEKLGKELGEKESFLKSLVFEIEKLDRGEGFRTELDFYGRLVKIFKGKRQIFEFFLKKI